jgi:hypothetical protein
MRPFLGVHGAATVAHSLHNVSQIFVAHMVLDPCGLLNSNIGSVPSLHLTSPAVVAEVKVRQTPPDDWNYFIFISSSKTIVMHSIFASIWLFYGVWDVWSS